jgi:hypothetical protein
MPDMPTAHTTDNSPEQVAYQLVQDVARIEGPPTTRKELLDRYAECLEAVRAHRPRAY